MITDILSDFAHKSLSKQWAPTWPMPKDVYNDSTWPWLEVDFVANFNAMLKECQLNDHMFVGHRQQDKHLSYNHEGWSALTLHGIAADKTEHWPQYGFKTMEEAGLHWTDACNNFPITTDFVKSLGYGTYDRVRIMRLAPGGFIMPHTDGEGRIFGPLNIAINNPRGCNFFFEEWGCVPFEQGKGFFLDIGYKHMVWNNSNEPRYHIIVHGWDNPSLANYAFTQFKNKYEPV